MADKDSHSTNSSVSVNNFYNININRSILMRSLYSLFFSFKLRTNLFSNTAKLHKKRLEILLLLYYLPYFLIRPNEGRERNKNFCLFGAPFEQLHSRKATFDSFRATFEQLIRKSRATCGKP